MADKTRHGTTKRFGPGSYEETDVIYQEEALSDEQ
jgi:hypothetical protein